MLFASFSGATWLTVLTSCAGGLYNFLNQYYSLISTSFHTEAQKTKEKSRARDILRLVEIQFSARFPLGDFFRAKRLSIVKIE